VEKQRFLYRLPVFCSAANCSHFNGMFLCTKMRTPLNRRFLFALCASSHHFTMTIMMNKGTLKENTKYKYHTSMLPIYSTGSCPCIHQGNIWWSGGTAPFMLQLGTRGRRVVSFMPQETVLSTHWTGGWTGPRHRLETVEKGRICCYWWAW
jgi:hypothetical protein